MTIRTAAYNYMMCSYMHVQNIQDYNYLIHTMSSVQCGQNVLRHCQHSFELSSKEFKPRIAPVRIR